MKLTDKDISGIDSKYSENNSNVKKEDDEDDGNKEEELEEEGEGYNPNWTLRKCCSKILDILGIIYPTEVYEIVKPALENDMQHSDWLTKERSILALGAVAFGLYSNLKPYLTTLISYLIRELEHPQKLVRAISCWTLSRFNKFILVENLSENSDELFKNYLCEILKKFLDKDIIVQEAACTAFSNMMVLKKERLEPYLFDIFKIISNAFNHFTGSSLLTLYDIICLITQYYPDHFTNISLIEEVVNCVVRRWYDMIKTNDNKNITPIFEMVSSIIKVSTDYCAKFFDYFLSGSLILIENNFKLYVENKDIAVLDKELLSKCIDLISTLCQNYPTCIREHPSKFKIVELFFQLFSTNDNYLKHYLISMIGDLGKADNNVLITRINDILTIIFKNLDFPESNNIEVERLSICNNSCWTIGLLAIGYPDYINLNIQPIILKLLQIMSFPRLNKSLAQNISICIGRLALIDVNNVVSNYLDSFLKQFCLSLRFINNTPEKREAFSGLCKAILHNPNGATNYFAFFCDAVCQYDDAPEDLENLFQNIVQSYKNTLKEKWSEYFKLFPEKLKVKMINRFKFK